MAKVMKGNDSRISGMIGPLVFVNFRGGTYVRTAPRSRKKNEWSGEQTGYRQKFSKVCYFWRRQTYDSTKKIWGIAAENMNGFNLFVKTNLPAFGNDGTVTDLERFHVSTGKLPLPHKLNAERVAGDPEKVEVQWEDDSDEGLALPDDELMMVTARDGKFSAPIATGALRSQQSAVIPLLSGTGTIQGIYLYFGSDRRKLYSVDQWFGI
jgi:hypothetical protein